MRRQIAVLGLVLFIDQLSIAIIAPYLALYYKEMGASNFVATAQIAILHIVQIFSAPVLGAISDRIGRKKILISCFLLNGVGFAMLAGNSLWFITMRNVFCGVGLTSQAIVFASLAEITAPEQRTRVMGLSGLAWGLAATIGPAMVLVGDMRTMASISFAICFLGSLATAFFFKEPTRSPVEGKSSTKNWKKTLRPRFLMDAMRKPRVGDLICSWTMFYLTLGTFWAGYPIWFVERVSFKGTSISNGIVGLLYTCVGVITLFVQLFLYQPILKRFGDRLYLLTAYSLMAFTLLLLTFASGLGPALLAILTIGFSQTSIRPLLLGMASKQFPGTQQGVLMGQLNSINSICFVLGPGLSGILLNHNRFTEWPIVISGICTLGVLSLLGLRPFRLKPSEQITSEHRNETCGAA